MSSSINSTCLFIFFALNVYCCPLNRFSFCDLLVIALQHTVERAGDTAQVFINQKVLIIPPIFTSLKDAEEIWVVFKRVEAAVPHAELLATFECCVRNRTKVKNIFLLSSCVLCDLQKSLL